MFLTVAEICLRYRISRTTLHRILLDDDSDFPRPLKVGGQLRFPVEQLQRWENSQSPIPETVEAQNDHD